MKSSCDEFSTQLNQCIFGEKIKIIDQQENWCYIKLISDGYQGWVKKSSIGEIGQPTHSICRNNTLIYQKPSSMSLSIGVLPLEAKIKVKSSNKMWSKFFYIYKNKNVDAFIFNKNIQNIRNKTADWVATAETFLNKPYLWGGRTFLGIDCSGLVQISLQTALINFPRDTNLQIKFKKGFTEESQLKRGSLVFWEGHVGIMINPFDMIHANGFHMRVNIEKLDVVKKRIKSKIIKFINL
tara:strand:+ start:193 stop:909 length:717 start_codon:yes stop_codon:yes gene_type:complete